jgi:hypothetical protein
MHWNTVTGEVLGQVAMPGHETLWLSPNGKFVATQIEKQTVVFETMTLKRVGTVGVGFKIGLSDDGKKAVICQNGTVGVESVTP